MQKNTNVYSEKQPFLPVIVKSSPMPILRSLLLACTITIACPAPAQQQAKYALTKYERITTDPFKNVPASKLILDYYCTSGFSTADRYWLEVVVIEDKLTVSFHSFEGAHFRKADYQRTYQLPAATVNSLKETLKAAGLKQQLEGIPVPETQAATKEVLIARHKNFRIGGGRYNHTLFRPGMSQADIDKAIAAEHASNTSISGNFDGMVAALKKQFTALDSLLLRARK